jgi:Protein of unknown function (DUF1579)
MSMKTSFLMAAMLLTAAVVMAEEPAGDPMANMPMGAPPEMKTVEHLVGTWDVDSKMKMMPTDTNWMVSKAVATFSYMLDGCVMKMDYEGPIMGMNFHGMHLMTYNRQTNKWQIAWVDNMSGLLSIYEGVKKDDVTVVEGVETMMGMTYRSRMTTYNETATAFDWKAESSYDEGKTWGVVMTAHYTKRAK